MGRSRIRRTAALVAMVLSLACLSSCSSSGESDVDWENYSADVRSRIDAMANQAIAPAYRPNSIRRTRTAALNGSGPGMGTPISCPTSTRGSLRQVATGNGRRMGPGWSFSPCSRSSAGGCSIVHAPQA
jgi:hypothetical protein